MKTSEVQITLIGSRKPAGNESSSRRFVETLLETITPCNQTALVLQLGLASNRAGFEGDDQLFIVLRTANCKKLEGHVANPATLK